MSKNPLAIIFDMDGVLVDSIQPHYQTWRETALALGGDLAYDDFRRLFGQAYPVYFDAMGIGNLSAEERYQNHLRKEARYRELVADNFPALPGVNELIGDLADAGFLLAVGSSGPIENVQLALAKIPNGKRFTSWTCGDDVKKSKPAPDIFLKAAERLQVAPQFCAVIEDSIHGLNAARAAGMKAVGITTTAARAELLPHADLIVDAMSELTPARLQNLIIG